MTGTNMTGFNFSPYDFSSLMDYGKKIPINPLTGSPDYLESLRPEVLKGIDLDNSVASNAGSSFGGVGDWFNNSGFLGKSENGITTQGWGGAALGLAQGLGNAWMGMKQYGLAKDQLAQSKKQFELNFGAQKKITNSALEDRQRARVASNPGAYESVGEYMKKNGI